MNVLTQDWEQRGCKDMFTQIYFCSRHMYQNLRYNVIKNVKEIQNLELKEKVNM